MDYAERAAGTNVLKTKSTEVKEACSRAKVAVPLSVTDLDDYRLKFVTATAADDVSSDHPLRGTTKGSEFQIRYICLLGQLRSVTSTCDT